MIQRNTQSEAGTTLVVGATGKTGRRVAERLAVRGLPVRPGSRSAEPRFDWEDRTTWAPVLRDIGSVYLTYYPDLAVPGAVDAVHTFVEVARASGVERMVLLSGRGEEEAQRAEQVVRDSGMAWTIVRSSWFSQNFSENYFRDLVVSGDVVLPAGAVGEPFVDADDIADVAVAALTEPGHAGQLYEVSGPRLLTFEDAVGEIAEAAGRPIRYTQVTPEAYASALVAEGVPADFVWLVNYLFTTVLDGRNAHLTDGVQRALGREPRDFREYARDAGRPVSDNILATLTVLAALGCGLVGGVFFAFSTFVMWAFGRLPSAQGIAAMQAINVAAPTPPFMSALFGTALCCIVVVIAAVSTPEGLDAILPVAGAMVYLVGTVVVTTAFNVPRNDALAQVDPLGAGAEGHWHRYLAKWNAWNHVRTVTSLAAAVLLAVDARL